MRPFIFFAVALAALVNAQPSLGNLPDCAHSCVNTAISSTGCTLANVTCFCSATSFLYTIAPCIAASCSVADQQATETFADTICSAVGVTLPSFSTLLNATGSSAASSNTVPVTSAASSSSHSNTATSPAATGTGSSVSASGRIEGDMRAMIAIAAMVGVVAVAFFAV